MNSDVWINEHHLGNHSYGYTPFYYDLTPYLKQNGENLLAVRVRNEGKNSRWYSGSGIYRHVWLTTTNLAHIEQWGVYITTPKVSESAATINVQTTVIHQEQHTQSLKLRTRILDVKEKVVAVAETPVNSDAINQNIQVSHPHLWSPQFPYLYHAITDVIRAQKSLIMW